MIPRVLEPEVMDAPDEAADYDAMDHSEVNDRFVADFLRVHGPCGGGTILDVGTGTARIPIALCRVDEAADVLGIDLATSMLDIARRNVAESNLGTRVRLERIDAKALPFDDGRFAAAMTNTILHHIPEPAPVLAEMLRVVRPGGTLFVRDLARPESDGEVARIVERYAGGESAHARALFEASLHAALTLGEIRAMAEALGLPRGCVAMTSDRHWTLAWRKPSEVSAR